MEMDKIKQLPPHVYETWEEYFNSPERENNEREHSAKQSISEFILSFGGHTVPRKPPCKNIAVHRDLYHLHAWATVYQDHVCLYCHPDVATPYGVLILSWLLPERVMSYMALLLAESSPEETTPNPKPVRTKPDFHAIADSIRSGAGSGAKKKR